MTDDGRLVAGRYRLTNRIGSGAMGVVWTARDERLQRTVAVKQLLLNSSMSTAESNEAKHRFHGHDERIALPILPEPRGALPREHREHRIDRCRRWDRRHPRDRRVIRREAATG